MNKFLAPLVASALILGGGAAFAEDQAKPPMKAPHDRFKEADTNNDGFITKDEMLATHQKRIDEMFAKTDTNKDGKLSKEELEKGREAMKKHWKERKEGGPDGGPPPADGAPPEGKPPVDAKPTTK